MTKEQAEGLAMHIADMYIQTAISHDQAHNMGASMYSENYFVAYKMIMDDICKRFGVTMPEEKKESSMVEKFL